MPNQNGVGAIDAGFGSPGPKLNLSGNDVFIWLGQSNSDNLRTPVNANLNNPAITSQQPRALWSYILKPGIGTRTTWETMAPFRTDSTQSIACGPPHQIAFTMLCNGLRPSIAEYTLEGVDSSVFVAEIPLILAFVDTLLAQLDAPNVIGGGVYQGENNAQTAPLSLQWQADWATVWTAVRAHLAMPDLPLTIVRLPDSYAAPFLGNVQAQQVALGAALAPHAAVVTYNASTFIDGVHLDVPSYQTVGELVANAAISL